MKDFPDYEAAEEALWHHEGQVADEAVGLFVSKGTTKGVARLIVDAALGDEVLYRNARPGDAAMGILAVCPVWPKEER